MAVFLSDYPGHSDHWDYSEFSDYSDNSDFPDYSDYLDFSHLDPDWDISGKNTDTDTNMNTAFSDWDDFWQYKKASHQWEPRELEGHYKGEDFSGIIHRFKLSLKSVKEMIRLKNYRNVEMGYKILKHPVQHQFTTTKNKLLVK